MYRLAEKLVACIEMPTLEHTVSSSKVAHRYSVQANEEEPTAGSRCFRPLSHKLPSGREKSRSTSRGHIKHPKILVVDDNEINLKLLTGFMKKLKYEHVTATNGKQALDAYSASSPKFSVILMDLSMPIMDGVTATKEIRKIKQEEDERPCRIIACTGLGSNEAKDEAMKSGMDMYLTKPIGFKNLKQVLSEALEESEEVEEHKGG
jgi:CheY-like chemotaxis protein